MLHHVLQLAVGGLKRFTDTETHVVQLDIGAWMMSAHQYGKSFRVMFISLTGGEARPAFRRVVCFGLWAV